MECLYLAYHSDRMVGSYSLHRKSDEISEKNPSKFKPLSIESHHFFPYNFYIILILDLCLSFKSQNICNFLFVGCNCFWSGGSGCHCRGIARPNKCTILIDLDYILSYGVTSLYMESFLLCIYRITFIASFRDFPHLPIEVSVKCCTHLFKNSFNPVTFCLRYISVICW